MLPSSSFASFFDLSDQVLETILEATVDANGGRPLAAAEMLSMGGAIGRVAEEATAYGHRDASVDFLAVAGWTDRHEDDDHLAAARRIWEGVAGRGAYGVYVNNLGDEGQDRVREAYGDAKYRRLAARKARYDPSNVLRAIAPVLPPFANLITLLSIDVYGSPSDAVLAQLRRKAAMLGDATVTIHDPLAGVRRTRDVDRPRD